MPKRRPPREVWEELRRIIWNRDGGKCTHCHEPVALEACHIDHIRSGKRGTNKIKTLEHFVAGVTFCGQITDTEV